jgi:hypothetical protein
MTNPDFRALCAELVETLEGRRFNYVGILDRARAALAEPKPPSLKEQALHAADLLFNHVEIGECALAQATIRRALEALPDG